MKVILTQEVRGVGAPGDIVDVADGYGRNYLLPRNLAQIATKAGVAQAEAIRKRRLAREVANLEQAQTLASHLGSLRVVMPAKAGKEGRLFGSITPLQVAEAVSRVGGVDIDRRRLSMEGPLKQTGHHLLRIRLHPEVEATLNVEVVPA